MPDGHKRIAPCCCCLNVCVCDVFSMYCFIYKCMRLCVSMYGYNVKEMNGIFFTATRTECINGRPHPKSLTEAESCHCDILALFSVFYFCCQPSQSKLFQFIQSSSSFVSNRCARARVCTYVAGLFF